MEYLTMIAIEVSRAIAAAVAAVLLGYALYVAAYVKHKNAILDERNDRALTDKVLPVRSEDDLAFKVRVEKVSSWYMGYRLALLGLIVTAAAVGWVAAWAVGQDHVLSWVEDAFVAFAGAVIGGFCLDKYIIHPIADGSFFEKVEDPIVQRFLQDAVPDAPVKEKRKLFKKKDKTPAAEPVSAAEEAPADPVGSLTFDEKVKLIEELKKSL